MEQHGNQPGMVGPGAPGGGGGSTFADRASHLAADLSHRVDALVEQ